MNGLEISRKFFEEFGRPMLENDFADIMPYLCCGLVGSGSERYGFDDDISRDHDFEPGFCIFMPGEDVIDRKRAFQLERAYAKLPKEYMGIERTALSPVGGSRTGLISTEEFYTNAAGAHDGELSIEQWLTIPDYALAEAVNGEVYFDNYGQFSKIRDRLMNMPEDVRLKRVAGNLLIMAQSGQYNYLRCLKHGENEAAQLACTEFVNAAMKVIYLLNGRYMPYYKWSFRGLRKMVAEGIIDESIVNQLSFILTAGLPNYSDSTAEHSDSFSTIIGGSVPVSQAAIEKYDYIEETASNVITMLQERGMTKAICTDLEKHAYSVNDEIADGDLRNMHVLAAV